jgi:hypothetical protein
MYQRHLVKPTNKYIGVVSTTPDSYSLLFFAGAPDSYSNPFKHQNEPHTHVKKVAYETLFLLWHRMFYFF